MRTMKAVVRRERTLLVEDVPVPEPRPGEIRVRVAVAGVCRTDVLMARTSQTTPLTLGHEFAGVVEAVGEGVPSLKPGDRVAVQPIVGCRDCETCRTHDEIDCPDRLQLGVDLPGAFAEYVCVPARLVYPVPEHVETEHAAYAEPVAAALGVTTLGLSKSGPGLVLGRNRFSTLVARVMNAAGYRNITLDEPTHSSYSWVVETGLTDGTIDKMARALAPGGTMVIRSRNPGDIRLDLTTLLRKRLAVRGANYGPFRLALSMLADRSIRLDDLIGPSYPLGRFAAAFARDESGESDKTFLTPE